jgi:regulator of sigma E protease
MTPMGWLAQNGVFLLVLATLIVLIYRSYGAEVLWKGAIMLVGLGFLIFVHELGHFLAAKWCDVHVQTFSIGFGPALPGCTFRKGETTYKLAVFPLGGYVNMVGEGPEADEDENYPRSFKNKTVGQRMLIISAGVFMNILVGALLFIFIYMWDGEHYQPAVVGTVEPGSPMFLEGIRTGSVISQINKIKDPSFRDLREAVALSTAGEAISFTFVDPTGARPPRRVDLIPRKEPSDPNPVIGVRLPHRLKVREDPHRPDVPNLATVKDSAAAAARPLGLHPGDMVVATSDPENPEKFSTLDHKPGPEGYHGELAQRVRKAAGKKLVLRIQPAGGGAIVDRDVPETGFAYGDKIVGMTRRQDIGPGYDPLAVDTLPEDPRNPGGGYADPFEYLRRMQQFLGLPAVVRVQRDGAPDGETVDLYVPPAYHYTFGTRMKMGAVAAVRDASPAAQKGLKAGDLLVQVELRQASNAEKGGNTGIKVWDNLDPERLSYQLAQEARKTPGPKEVILTVKRGDTERLVLPAIPWDTSWDYDDEEPSSGSAPVAIPQLGVAYWIESGIVEVLPGSPAADAGLRPKDWLEDARVQTWGRDFSGNDWSELYRLKSERHGEEVYESWAQFSFWLGLDDFKTWKFTVNRPGGGIDNLVTMTAVEDPTWPMLERGLRLTDDTRTRKAGNAGEALVMGCSETWRWIKSLYAQLRSLLSGRVSTRQLGGPLQMFSIGVEVVGGGPWEVLKYLAIISINLAVVNFLPIPVLDGGHMLFLLYEKLRGRPPSEMARAVGTYIGLAAILSLMVFVFYQDIRRLFFKL